MYRAARNPRWAWDIPCVGSRGQMFPSIPPKSHPVAARDIRFRSALGKPDRKQTKSSDWTPVASIAKQLDYVYHGHTANFKIINFKFYYL